MSHKVTIMCDAIPADFRFQLAADDVVAMRSQIVTASGPRPVSRWSQTATTWQAEGGTSLILGNRQ